MGNIKDLDSTALYAYTTAISVLICVPAALLVEGKHLSAGVDKALAKNPNFYWALLSVGLLYHLYNQVRCRDSPQQSVVGPGHSPDLVVGCCVISPRSHCALGEATLGSAGRLLYRLYRHLLHSLCALPWEPAAVCWVCLCCTGRWLCHYSSSWRMPSGTGDK